VERGGQRSPLKSEDVKTEAEPPQGFLDAVEIMRERRRITWKRLCHEEMTRSTKDPGEAQDITKDTKREKEPPSEHGASSSEETDGSIGYTEEERNKFRTEGSPRRSVTPTSPVPSDEEAKSPTRERTEKKKKQESPKKKKYHRRSQKGETISSDSSGKSLHTDEPTPLELKGGQTLKVGTKGSGRFEVIVRKIAKKRSKERTKKSHKKGS
jgi:hypothetical protein